MNNNYSDVYATAVTGGLRHAQSGIGTGSAGCGTVVAPQSWLSTRNDAMRLAVVRNATPVIAGFAPMAAKAAMAKQAPQSRGSSAHT